MSRSQLPPCPQCGNINFEEENGILVCTACGRQQEGGLQVADDELEFGTQGKITRQKVEKKKVKVFKVYRGPRAYRLYLLAWQHVLWKQCHALAQGSTQFPEILWDVVRDLWGLQLASLTAKLAERGSSGHEQIGSPSEVDASALDEEGTGQDKNTRPNLQPKLWDTLGLIYLGCLLIRRPLCLSDLYDLICDEKIPFIRAIRHVPVEITTKLPSEYQEALDTLAIPTAVELERATYRLLQDYTTVYGISMPPLNWRILLFQWIQSLCLPIEIYQATEKLAEIVNYDFTYRFPSSQTSAAGQSNHKSRRGPASTPEVQLMSLIVIATKSLFPFNLPGSIPSRSTTSPQSSGAPIKLDWQTWYRIHSAPSPTSSTPPSYLPPSKAITLTPSDIQSLPTEALDSYMAWYEKTFVVPEPVIHQKKTDLERTILEMFPLSLPSVPSTSTIANTFLGAEGVENVMSKVSQAQKEAIRPSSPPQPPPHGNGGECEDESWTPLYLVISDLKALRVTKTFFNGHTSKNPVVYFHDQVARLACLDVKRLLTAVRHTERKIEKWVEEQKRDMEADRLPDV